MLEQLWSISPTGFVISQALWFKTNRNYMNRLISNLNFKFMPLSFKLRDFFLPPRDVLDETGIEKGFYVVDYGCGPGSYAVDTAELVGRSEKVFALDVNPLAVTRVQNIATRVKLENVEVIRSDRDTGLPDNSIDVVLLYDTFHDLNDPEGVLKEIHRVLKPDKILSFSDHHMKENEIISKAEKEGLFKLYRKGKKTYSFVKKVA